MGGLFLKDEKLNTSNLSVATAWKNSTDYALLRLAVVKLSIMHICSCSASLNSSMLESSGKDGNNIRTSAGK